MCPTIGRFVSGLLRCEKCVAKEKTAAGTQQGSEIHEDDDEKKQYCCCCCCCWKALINPASQYRMMPDIVYINTYTSPPQHDGTASNFVIVGGGGNSGVQYLLAS